MTTQTDVDVPWIVFGDYLDAWGEPTAVGLPMVDLATHSVASGTTGSGKSTFLRGLAKQFWELGGTVVVIEPHGDLILDPVEGILAELPADRLDQVAVLDFAGPCPPQLNVAALDLKRSRSVAVDTAMLCIEVVESAGWEGGVRLREILEHVLHLVLELNGSQASMLDVQAFLMEEDKRQAVMAEVGDTNLGGAVGESVPYLRELLKEFTQSKQASAQSTFQYPLRRVGRFFRNEYLRRSLALPRLSLRLALDLDRLLNAREPALILVPLRATKLGDDAKRAVGTLLMQTLSNLFMARADQPKAERAQTLVIIDEFADLAGSQVGPIVNTLLAQARKFGASIVLATQSLAQLPKEVQKEVMLNTNVKVVLRPADLGDAMQGAASLGSPLLKPMDLFSIERWSGYARVLVHGAPQPPFYFRALGPYTIPASRPRQLVLVPPQPRHALLDHLHGLARAEGQAIQTATTGLAGLLVPLQHAGTAAAWTAGLDDVAAQVAHLHSLARDVAVVVGDLLRELARQVAALRTAHGVDLVTQQGQVADLSDLVTRLQQVLGEEPQSGRAVLRELGALDDQTFAELVRAQERWNTWEAAHLLADPSLEPDPVQRALRISRARYGLPWWLYEAQYRRERFGPAGSTPAAAPRASGAAA